MKKLIARLCMAFLSHLAPHSSDVNAEVIGFDDPLPHRDVCAVKGCQFNYHSIILISSPLQVCLVVSKSLPEGLLCDAQ